MSKKYYAVKVGATPGIYTTWDEAQAQVSGFNGAIFKSFKSLEDAQAFMGNIVATAPVTTPVVEQPTSDAELIAYSDGSFNPATNMVGASSIVMSGSQVIDNLYIVDRIKNDVVGDTRNVGGELVGAINAIRYALVNGFTSIEIFYDYAGVGQWADHTWKAKNHTTREYVAKVDELRKLMNIKFTKVKAHADVEFNELADRIAKFAVDVELSAADQAQLDSLTFTEASDLD